MLKIAMLPALAAMGLSLFSDMPPWLITLLVVALALLLALAAVVGKIIRNDPDEKMVHALLIGLFAGALSIIVAFATEVGNLWGVASFALVASLQGPKFVKSKMEEPKEK